jgi:hypothetical protein
MATPGFSAAASIYVPSLYYVTVFGSSLGSPQLTLPALPIGNGGGNGGHCEPDIGPCGSDCMRTITPCVGRPFKARCCGPGYQCQNGSCVCPAPNTDCGDVCADLSSNANNCGQCGNICPTGTTCQQGGCYPQPTECGACTPGPNSTQTCCTLVSPDERQCGISPCPPGCGGQPYPWCGQSYPTVISCPCPTGQVCRSRCSGELCSVDWFCQPPA